MCNKITYLCACGHYSTATMVIICRGFRRSTLTSSHSCSNAHKSSTPWNRRTAGTRWVDYQSDRRNVASQVRTPKSKIWESIKRCEEFNIEKRDRSLLEESVVRGL